MRVLLLLLIPACVLLAPPKAVASSVQSIELVGEAELQAYLELLSAGGTSESLRQSRKPGIPNRVLVKLVKKLKKAGPKSQGGQKVMAASLGLLLGPFGVHRLYLGTDTRVPVFYTLTLGGGFGLLPVCDIVAILITPDLEKYMDSPRFVMWAK